MPHGAVALRRAFFRPLNMAVVVVVTLGSPVSSYALSELRNLPSQGGSTLHDTPSEDDVPTGGGLGLPVPDPLINPPADDSDLADETDSPDDVEILDDISQAPEPVQRMRQLIMDAATSGDPAKLRPLLNPGPNQTQLQLSGTDGDPLEVLKGFSGDEDGLEILAIILDVLSARFAHVNAGTPTEMYVWPYFAEKPLSDLTAPERVQLFRIITAGDFASMLEVGNYNFFRIGISPDGQWKFLLAGD